jgi:hypothetical protein
LKKGTLNVVVDAKPIDIPAVSPTSQYALQRTNMFFDPSIVNTPPSEFINTLKQRIGIYYETGGDTK